MQRKDVYTVLLLILLCQVSAGSKVGPSYLHDKMYSYHSGAPCVRLIGREGAIGCTTSSSGESGWLFPVESSEEVIEFTNSPPSGDLIVVLASDLFVPGTIALLKGASDLKGILVLQGDGPTYFSPAAQNPNKQYGLYPHSNSSVVWNPNGTAWNYQNQEIPMFALDASESQKMLQYAKENKESSHYPKWAIKMTAWMHTQHDNNVETCIRRQNCLPLGGRNIWGALNPITPQSNQKLLIAMAAMDSNAFFHDLAVGGNADISGTIALLSAANALSAVDRKSWVKQPVFVLFNGESYGYIGSKAFVEDLKDFSCSDRSSDYCKNPYRLDLAFENLRLEQIDSLIELNQVGHFPNSDETIEIFPHMDSESGDTSSILNSLIEASAGTKIRVSDGVPKGQELPPSSLMSFLSADRGLKGIVLSDHASEYVNPYFHSRFDNSSNINLDAICSISTLLARSLFLQGIEGTEDKLGLSVTDIQADCLVVSQLVVCLTINTDCEILQNLYRNLVISGTLPPPSNYVGVYQRKSYPFQTSFLRDWMINATATIRSGMECNTTSQCESAWEHCKIEANGRCVCLSGECIAGYNVHLHEALSPAFVYNYEERKIELVDPSPQWPLWTESYWQEPYLTLFKIDAPWVGPVVFISGLFEFIVCLVLVKYGISWVPKHLKLT